MSSSQQAKNLGILRGTAIRGVVEGTLYIRGDLGVGRPGGRGVWEIGRAGLIPGDEVQVLFGPFALDHNAGGCSG